MSLHGKFLRVDPATGNTRPIVGASVGVRPRGGGKITWTTTGAGGYYFDLPGGRYDFLTSIRGALQSIPLEFGYYAGNTDVYVTQGVLDHGVGAEGGIPTKYDPSIGFTRSTGPIAPPPGGSDRPSGDPPLLQRGSKGPWVGYLQRRIGTGVDDDFGPKTERAVKAYQASKGLAPSGQVDPATWAAAESSTAGLPSVDAIQDLAQAVSYARIGWNAAMNAAGKDVAKRNAFLAAADGYRWVYDLASWKMRLGLASSEVQDWILNLRQALRHANTLMGASARGAEPPPTPKRDPAPRPISVTPSVPIITTQPPVPVDVPVPPVPPPAPESSGGWGLGLAAAGLGAIGIGMILKKK